MIKQHAKRMARAEKCCAAFREFYSMSDNDPRKKWVERKAINYLLSWMRVAPMKVKYKHTPTETGK